VFRQSSLVTFFYASRRKLLGSRAETRRAAAQVDIACAAGSSAVHC
jgi:hypothetical protein